MQIFPTKPDSHLIAVGRGQALSLHLQGTNLASQSLGWLIASCEQEGREEDESRGEAVLSLHPPEQLHHPCCTPHPPQNATWAPKGTAEPHHCVHMEMPGTGT